MSEQHEGKEVESTGTSTPQPQAGDNPQQRQAVELNDDNASICYANFCRVTGTPEELILDFGLNSQPSGAPTEAIEVKHRLVVNYFTAKRMLQALAVSVQRHEQVFGVLETDVQKRVAARPPRVQAQTGS